MAVSLGAPGSVADVVLTPAITLEMVVEPAGTNWHMPATSQSPAPREMLAPFAAVQVVRETLVRLLGVGYSPTLPEFALSFVAVPTMPAVLDGVIVLVACNVVNFPVFGVTFPRAGGDAKIVFVKAVVAICVVLVPAAAVGAVGTPVKAGEANVA